MKTKIVKFTLLGSLMLIIVVAALFSLVQDVVMAQNKAPEAFDTSFTTDPVYTHLKEFSTIPIQVDRIEKGRTEPFSSY